MKLAVFAFTRRGCNTAQRVKETLKGEARMFTTEKFLQPGFEPCAMPLADFTAPVFGWADVLVFVGSCGIAVRAIAPHVRSKKTDPAVIVTDDAGQFVIPLLSGHIGGANRYAQTLAAALGGTAVLTTSTDVNHRFAADQWAAENGLHIGSMTAAKAVAAAILEGEVPIASDFPIVTPLPGGTVAGNTGPVGIYIGCRNIQPFDRTLHLIPRVLHLGIGCRKGIAPEAVEQAINHVLADNHLCWEAVKQAASIDLKSGEPGLLQFCGRHNIPVSFHSAEELLAVSGDFSPSAFVKTVTGVDNVCERAAMLGACRLIVKKTALNGVTVAVAAEKMEVAF